tara:strand:- start:1080 stop:1424 length:345 start_codon:yes stop_codon:yes gene_type:complete
MNSLYGLIDTDSIYEERIIGLNRTIIQLKNENGKKDTTILELREQIKSLEFLVANLLPSRIQMSPANIVNKIQDINKNSMDKKRNCESEFTKSDIKKRRLTDKKNYNKKRKLTK